nr:glycosyltransferase [uncultured Brumimicrobium sp.]
MKITLIVPVYNIEKDLSSCLDSILNQDFKDYELLLINDGSTDSSGEICNKYALKDNRIQVFHQENKGVSAARNLGLEWAKGEWICFVDGDDMIHSNSLSTLIKATENNRLEMLIARSFVYKNGETKSERYKFDETFLEKSFDGYELITDKSYKRGSVCGCIFNTNFLKINKIKFPLDLKIGEDSIFITLVHLYSQYIVFIDQIFYLINEREGSASRSWTPEKVLKMTDSITFIKNYIEKHPQLSKSQLAILDYRIYGVVSTLFYNFYYCFSFKYFFKIMRNLKNLVPVKIETLDIQMSKSKVKLLNFSLPLFAVSVLLKQLFREKLKQHS